MAQQRSGLSEPRVSDNARAANLSAEAQAFVPGQLSVPPAPETSSTNVTPFIPPHDGSAPPPGGPIPLPLDAILGPQRPLPPPPSGLGPTPGFVPHPPIVPAPESVGSNDSYDDDDDIDIPVPPWVGLKLGPSHDEEVALRDASTWTPVRPEPIGNVPHKALPNFKDPRWTGALSASYVPYWTSPVWDMRMEEDWHGEVYMERLKPEDRMHYGRPAILKHPIDEWVIRTAYAL
ncbi:hypothetical protein N0V82_004400 [Gnomoniopsis sp. IMI 355080]|nr:hypothetical protein N0V82_004400 [Gnomoniopsis sp. IMI 355080]